MKLKLKTTILSLSSVYLEWIEFSIYVYLASFFSKIFFPSSDKANALLMTLGIFMVSYFMRPLGGIISGYIADRNGRKQVMVLSIMLITIATLGIGLLPSYEQIGIAAPILLLVLRSMQGFALAMEFNNASIYLIEHSENIKDRIKLGALVSALATFGMATGAFIVSKMDLTLHPNLWRAPFLIFAILSYIIFHFRRNLSETPVFLEMQKTKKLAENPLLEMLKNKKELGVILAISSFIGIFLYAGHIYFTSFMVKHGGYNLQEASSLVFISDLVLTFFTIVFAIIATHYNKSVLFFKLGIISIGLTCPALFLIALHGPAYEKYMLAGLIIYALADALFASYIYYYLFSLVPASTRCSSIGSFYSLAIAIFGGTAPIISEYFVAKGYYYLPGLYIIIASLIAFIAVSAYKNKLSVDPQIQNT